MPWKKTCVVDERKRFVFEVLRREESISELCRRYEISRKTGHKWLDRYDEGGAAGLEDRSHAAHESPHRLSERIVEEILAVRYKHPTWGPKKILGWLEDRRPDRPWPAQSTIGELLHAKGLTVPRKRRRRVPLSAPFGSVGAPNDVWSVDFKGWFLTGDGQRCDPLTLQDAHSRYLLRCQAVERTDTQNVWPIFDAAFREFGLPLRVRSDNGPPFASLGVGGLSRFSIQLIKAGVTPERIAPGKPEQNGRHERFHLTLKRETASPPARNLAAQQRRFDAFRRLYNDERPHEALEQTPPERHYNVSRRQYRGRLKEPQYDIGTEVRRVRHNGEIKWRGELLYVGQALAGEPVGCEETNDGIVALRYGPVQLATIDHRGRLCILRRGSISRPPS